MYYIFERCCHPRRQGHAVLSLVLAYCMVEEEKLMDSYNEDEILDVECDYTVDDPPTLRDPVYLSPEEEALYVRNELAYAGVDVTDPNSQDSWKDRIVANDGWTWYADNVDKDKYGLIANSVTGGQHIAISLHGAQHGTVEISYTVSYENFGIALAWLGVTDKRRIKQLCGNPVPNFQPAKTGSPHRLFAIWEEPASVPKVDLIPDKLSENETKTLNICLTPRSKELAKGPDNKFKLLEVRVY